MTQKTADIGSRGLVSSLLRKWPLVMTGVFLGAVLGALLAASDNSDATVYETRALMVASSWEQRIEGLSRLVETVLQTNDFMQELRLFDPEAFPSSRTFDEEVSVIPVQDTVAVWVEATALSPDLAERRANATAEVLVAELNRLGVDIGIFTLQDRARPGQAVEADLGYRELVGIGGLAGLILTSGLVIGWAGWGESASAGGVAGSRRPPLPLRKAER